jgi:hypothetical protein
MKFKIDLDKHELEALKTLLKRVTTREPKITLSVDGETRGMARQLLKEIIDQEDFNARDGY